MKLNVQIVHFRLLLDISSVMLDTLPCQMTQKLHITSWSQQ